MADTLSEFYSGKTIFITGAAGYVGTVLLEILLRCFPGIERIYILLRPKKGMKPFDRKGIIFKKRIMTPLLKANPEVFNKVHVVSGDISQSNLGMSDSDTRKICQEASIVFHCAALISFTKPFRYIALENSKGTYNVMELCRKLKQLHVLVYTSTAYSNSHRYQEKVEEKIYPMPYSVQRFLDELENGNVESFTELVSSCNIRWPNSYTFSKCLAENILREKAADLPIAIIRPSAVFCALKGSLPGYIEEGSGLMDLSVATGKGFVKVLRVKKNAVLDLIPVDVVANSHVIAAWSVATGRSPSMLVINCTAGDYYRTTFESFIKVGIEIIKKNPLKGPFQKISTRQVENKFIYFLLSIYEHYIPAAVLDVYFRLKGRRLRLVKLYKFFDEMMRHLHFFMSRSFEFDTKNFKSLSTKISPEEREMIYTDLSGTFYELIENLPNGLDAFDKNLDRKSVQKRRHAVYVHSLLIEAIKKIVLFVICYLIYLFIGKLFF